MQGGPALATGTVFAKDFRVERALAAGGMGAVYVVEQLSTGRKRALKVMHPDHVHDEDARRRFVLEARIGARIKSEHVVEVQAAGVDESTGAPYLVMELLDGEDLAARLRREGPMAAKDVRDLFRQMCHALGMAHAEGIVHRDLKPQNIFLAEHKRVDGLGFHVKVLDFGIAKLTTEAGSRTGVIGTPLWMAPEQGEHGRVTAAADVWSLGLILYTVLTGRSFWRSGNVEGGASIQQVLREMFFDRLPSATERARDQGVEDRLPSSLEPIFAGSVVRQVEARFPDANAFWVALDASLAGGGAMASRPRSPTGSTADALAESTLTEAPRSAPAATDRLSRTPTPLPAKSEKAFEREERDDAAPFDATVNAPRISATPASKPRSRSGESTAAATEPLPAVATRPNSGAGEQTTNAALVARTSISPGSGRARRPLRWRAIAAGAVACALIAGGAVRHRAAHAPLVKLCALVLDTSDGPRCAIEVPGAAIAKRSDDTLRVTEIGGHVVTVEHVSFAGVRLGNSGTRDEVTRDEGGAVREIIIRDGHDDIIEWQKWSDGGRRIDFVDIDGTTPRHLDMTGVTTVKRELDSRGLVTRETYLGATGRPRPDSDGAYGRLIVNGKLGRAIRVTILGADGKPAADSSGRGSIQRSDDGSPEGAETRVFDVEGKPMGVQGVHLVRVTWSDAFNQTSWLNFGIHDEPVVSLDPKGRTHGKRLTWNEATRMREVTWVDVTGRARSEHSGSFAKFRETYDMRGRTTLLEFLDGDGNPVMRHGDSATIRTVWDGHDDPIEVAHLDAAGRPMIGAQGHAKQTITYDEHGRPIERRSYDESGKLAVRTKREEGAAIQRLKYDARGLVVSLATFDEDGKHGAKNDGVSTELRRFDRFRNRVEVTYLGLDGKPIGGQEGLAALRESYDDNDDRVTEEFFDQSSLPLMLDGDYAARRIKNDERGLVLEERYIGAHGEPIFRREGYVTVKYARDRSGDVIEESYLGKQDEPVLRDGGYATRRIKYDIQRRPIEVTLLDAAGAPVVGTDGWAIERNVWDERGLHIREEHLDAASRPVLTKLDRASFLKVWDARGNRIEETSLGVDGKPVATSDRYATKKSVYAKKSTYDEPDDLIEESLFGADGKPVLGNDGWSIRQLRWDDVGNLVEEAFFDGEHKPVMPRDSTFASARNRYDARQRLVETTFLDGSGAPAKGPDGVACVRYQRDAYGRATETSYFDGSGVATVSRDGKMVVRSVFDDRGRLGEESFLGADGAPRLAKDGCAGRRTKYDLRGRRTEEQCLATKDGVAMSTDGWATRRTLHDARGNPVDVATYGADGALHADKDGVARRKTRFDERNLALETSFFDATDKPTRDRHGVAMQRFTYNDSGKRTGETALDRRGKPIAPKK